MANTIPAVMTQLTARAVNVLRRRSHMARYVTTAYSLTPGQKGKTVDVEIPPTQTAGAITAANSTPSNTDVTATTVAVTLDKWYGADFHMSDQDMSRVDKDLNFFPAAAEASLDAVVKQVDDDLLGLHTDVYSAGGTAGTTPFASTAAAYTTGSRKLLNESLAPTRDRYVVLDADAEANAVNLSAFQSLYASGDQNVIVEGEIGRKLGADWALNQGVISYVGGTLTNGSGKLAKVNDASYTVGESTVDIDDTSLSGTIVKGDIFTVAGDTQQYVVTAGQTAAGNAIAAMAFTPTSKVAWADDAVVTFVADHQANLNFQRGAFALATAPLESAPDGLGTMTQTIVDPLSGLTLRLEVSRQYKQTRWEWDVLYGVRTLRAELAAKILG
jgi:hypothetical protein